MEKRDFSENETTKKENTTSQNSETKQSELVSSNSLIPTEIIKLNIGGIKYMTTKSTLTRISFSFFSNLLEGLLPSTKDEEGYYFIDREGLYFSPILNYMRTGQIIVPSNIPIEALLQEADFYLLPDLWMKLQKGSDDPCGGKLFLKLLRSPDQFSSDKSNVVDYVKQQNSKEELKEELQTNSESKFSNVGGVQEMLISENEIVVIFESGAIQSWIIDGTTFSLNFSSALFLLQLNHQKIQKAAFFTNRVGRWFLSVFSQGELHLWTFSTKSEPRNFPLDTDSLDIMFFVKKGQDLIGFQLASGTIFLFSLASFTTRKIVHSSPITACCHFANEFGYCCSGNNIYQIMIGKV